MLLLVCYVLDYFESTIRYRVGQEMTRVMSLHPDLARLLVKKMKEDKEKMEPMVDCYTNEFQSLASCIFSMDMSDMNSAAVYQ